MPSHPGIVHWQPPAAALQRAAELVASGDPALSQYGPDEGLPELRQALREKLQRENGLTGVRWTDQQPRDTSWLECGMIAYGGAAVWCLLW